MTVKHFPDAVISGLITVLSSKGSCQILPHRAAMDGVNIDEISTRQGLSYAPKPGRTLHYEVYMNEQRCETANAQVRPSDAQPAEAIRVKIHCTIYPGNTKSFWVVAGDLIDVESGKVAPAEFQHTELRRDDKFAIRWKGMTMHFGLHAGQHGIDIDSWFGESSSDESEPAEQEEPEPQQPGFQPFTGQSFKMSMEPEA